jgi:DNA-binding NarL/FixJ family response regulator
MCLSKQRSDGQRFPVRIFNLNSCNELHRELNVQSEQGPENPVSVPAPTLRLVIASDIRFLRESLGQNLGRFPNLEIVGYGCTAGQAVGATHDLKPDLLLLDAALPNGLAAVRQVREHDATLPVVVFAITESVESVLLWAEAGIAGYIPNTAALCDLYTIVLDIVAGRQSCSAPVSAGLLRRVAATAHPAPDPAAPMLTAREAEIVGLMGTGLSNKEIARKLNIGLATTKSHVHNVLAKLSLQRRGQAARWIHARAPQG